MPMPKLMKNQVLSRDPNMGGISTLISGCLGSGKTSLSCDILKKLFDRRKEQGRPSKERFFWAGRVPCQWTKVVPDHFPDYQILASNQTSLDFFGEKKLVKELDLSVKKYGSFSDLWELSRPDCLNIVYEPYKGWPQFMKFFEESRSTFKHWATLALDEVSPLSPHGASGHEYQIAMKVVDILKESRKNQLSLIANTQSFSDMFWKALDKFMIYINLTGSRKIESKSRVYPAAIQSLKQGEGWVSSGNEFEKFKFDPYYSKKLRCDVKYNQVAPMPGELAEPGA